MKILVTGGAGYVGSHCCKALAAAGHEPLAFDNLSRGHRELVKWGPLIEGDINDRSALAAAFAQHRPDAVIHMAAYAYVGESVADPASYYANNVGGTLTLLDAMRDAGIGKLVFSSSCATFGLSDGMPIAETHAQQPVNPYGWTKLIGERMIADYAAAFGLGATILRYFNAAGADPDGETGEWHEPETHLIPLVLDAASGSGETIRVFGTDYATPDGSCVRDYVHATDLAAAHVLAVEACQPGQFSAYNLGEGRGYSVLDIIGAAERVTGRKVPVSAVSRRPGDPAILIANAHKARTELGWRPQFSGLDTIIATAWRWHRRAELGPVSEA